tara:strand:+ start:794 stop:988 length:195 start_codon:yes stop_codon:yes gene_type:complete
MLSIENKETRGRKFIVDEALKHCLECNQVWEKISKKVYSKSFEIYPIGHIPVIGKKKETCPRCR